MKNLNIFLFTFCLISCYRKPPLKTGKEGELMPSFNLLLMDSVTKFSTVNNAQGKAAVLFYFSPRCPYCRAELNMIIDDIDKMKAVQVYMVTNNFSFAETKGFCDKYKLSSYPGITVGYDSMYAIAKYFKVQGFPFSAVYGKDKKLKAAYMGMVKTSDILATANE